MTLTVLFSAAPDSLRDAAAELARLAPGAAPAEVVANDAALITLPRFTLPALAKACRETPVMFVRHLSAVDTVLSAEDLTALGERAVALAPIGAVGLQVWTAEGAPTGAQSDVLAAISSQLTLAGHEVRRGGAAFVIHACITNRGVVLGSAQAADTLTDWPGGRVRLRAGDDQLSRAAHKLEEAMLVFGLDLRGPGLAVDFGAAPGGWSRVLSARRYTVEAVDPARLDQTLSRDKTIHHRKETAQAYLAGPHPQADLLVNDMRLDALESADIMNLGSAALKPGGLGVITLKLPERRSAEVAQRALERLRETYEIIGARQLFHNRSEVTVAVRRD